MSEDHALHAYQFPLPPERIAQTPAPERTASRLMVLDGDTPPAHHVFRDLPSILQPGDVLVRNDTRVIPARLRGRRAGGGKTELLLTHPLARAPVSLRQHLPENAPDGGTCWLCLARPASHLKPGKVVTFGEPVGLTATVLAQCGGGRVLVSFDAPDDASLLARLPALGEVPLPPYIDRANGGPNSEDADRYQTTFARHPGAVAAPTAGLHFTDAIDDALRTRSIDIETLTLHVGPGTFRPMVADDIRDHAVDAEYYAVSPETATALNTARAAGRRVIAVGTTTTRTLESVVDTEGRFHAGAGWTDLFIRPGHMFRAIDGLLTNFHLPGSSLLVLVSALMGRERILEAYGIAVDAGYRFYSYGDAMLLLPARHGAEEPACNAGGG